MAEYKIGDIAKAVNGRLVHGVYDMPIRHFEFDSREINGPHSLFFAFTSEKNDGHQYIRDLSVKPDVAAVVSEAFDYQEIPMPMIIVKDPMKAAETFATKIREHNQKTVFIAITGSVGKTTTKEFCYQILSQKFKVFRSYKNWNNWIGLPFSLMRMDGNEDLAVFELGMSTPGIGEIDNLCKILKPQMSVILNVYPVHLEFLKTLDNIALAKSEILNYLGQEGTGFINGDSEELLRVIKGKDFKKVVFGTSGSHHDIYLDQVLRNDKGSELHIGFQGKHHIFQTGIVNRIQIENLFIACFMALFLKMDHGEIQSAVDGIKPVEKRGEIKKIGKGVIIDESYNSNPSALQKTLDWIDREYRSKRKVAVLGDMLELGKAEDHLHFEVGEFFAGLNYSDLIVVGPRAEKIAEGALSAGYPRERVIRCTNSNEAGKILRKILPLDESFLAVFKGSRGIKMEVAIEEFCRD